MKFIGITKRVEKPKEVGILKTNESFNGAFIKD